MSKSDILIGVAAIITAATPGFLAYLQSKKNHKVMNSRLTELLSLTRSSALAEGKIAGRAEEKQRKG